MLYLAAEARSPCSSVCSIRVDPHIGQAQPVTDLNGQAGRPLPGRVGSRTPATVQQARAAAAVTAGATQAGRPLGARCAIRVITATPVCT